MRLHRSSPLLLLFALLIHSGHAQQRTVADLLREGDEYSTKTFENQKALDKFLEALKIEPKNDELLWRISRSYVDIGEHLPTATEDDRKKQLECYQKALDYAEAAVQANPGSSMAYARRAIAAGRVALFKGVWDSIDIVKEVRADCEKAIQLDPNNQSAYYVLGRTHAKLCEKPKIFRWPLGLGWANYQDAEANYEKAIALRPTFIMYRLDAARTYVEVDNYGKAREYLTSIETLPTQDEDDDQFRREARELLEKIRNK